MANIMTNSVNYSAIASAIRARLGTTDKYKPTQMAGEIMKISGSDGGGYNVVDKFIDGSITEVTTQATVIKSYAMCMRENLQKFTAYEATEIGDAVFMMCSNLTELNIDGDKITRIGETSFVGTGIESIYLSRVTELSMQCFLNCVKLNRADFGSVTHMDTNVFSGCHALESVIIRTPTVCRIEGSTFKDSSITDGTGYVYVPAALIDEYKQTDCWKPYVNQLRAIEDYSEVTQG